MFLVKSRHFGLPLAQTIMAKLAISLSGWLGRYTNVEYLQSLYMKRRGQLLFKSERVITRLYFFYFTYVFTMNSIKILKHLNIIL